MSDVAIQMTPEALRCFGDFLLEKGKFYADHAATLDDFADAWQRTEKRLEEAEERCGDIMAVGFDYDGMTTAKDLKRTIDKMVRIARAACTPPSPRSRSETDGR